MLDVQKEWDRLCDSFGENTWTKMNYGERCGMLNDILRKRLSDRDLWELARSADVLPTREEDRTGFERSALDFMVWGFTESGDRESLVVLLSNCCPDRIGLYDLIEGYLALSEMVPKEIRPKRIKYPVLLLDDAYHKCRVPGVRHKIADVVRRGFSTMHVPGLTDVTNDDEYVDIAMKWYRVHKDELVPNLEYCSNRFPKGGRFPLFTWKTAGGKQK